MRNLDNPQLIFTKRFKSFRAQFLTPHVNLPGIKITALKNLSIIKRMQSHLSDRGRDLNNAKIKFIINV